MNQIRDIAILLEGLEDQIAGFEPIPPRTRKKLVPPFHIWRFGPYARDMWGGCVNDIAETADFWTKDGKLNYEEATRCWKNRFKREFGYRPSRTTEHSFTEAVERRISRMRQKLLDWRAREKEKGIGATTARKKDQANKLIRLIAKPRDKKSEVPTIK